MLIRMMVPFIVLLLYAPGVSLSNQKVPQDYGLREIEGYEEGDKDDRKEIPVDPGREQNIF